MAAAWPASAVATAVTAAASAVVAGGGGGAGSSAYAPSVTSPTIEKGTTSDGNGEIVLTWNSVSISVVR